LSAPATDPIPALAGNDAQVRQAERLRSGHIATLLDMDRNNTADGAVHLIVFKTIRRRLASNLIRDGQSYYLS
jgi:hypothetical protein